MYRCIFYYKIGEYYTQEIKYSARFCKRPASTKDYQYLKRRFNKGEISTFGYKFE